jgi:hypothetical protein
VFGGRADVLTHLDAAGFGADHSNALVFQVDAVLGPCSGVEVFTLEVAETFEAGSVAAGCEADGWDQPSGIDFAAIGAFDEPLLPLLVENGIVNALVVDNGLCCVIFLFDVVEVLLEFLPGGIFFGECVVFP